MRDSAGTYSEPSSDASLASPHSCGRYVFVDDADPVGQAEPTVPPVDPSELTMSGLELMPQAAMANCLARLDPSSATWKRLSVPVVAVGDYADVGASTR